ncbi:cyclic nucleotide-binding/CBS domain-containing protein [Candidatus Nitronereus thalassa]|uniref:CBS domain-containing protein n=1 Tax=Candidatus Nitronereus thalassa TaxID=3020898 RepID=A0ABU3K303_9BACT|nr:CBS domain-containing protein [Candidatus Nitronereus thalassa]MDT7040767.1 CBS domain-containing protein [Candidatus Nitronereus thalassa]
MGVKIILCPDCEKENLPGADLCESCSHDLTYLNRQRETAPIQKRIIQDSIALLSLRAPIVVQPQTILYEVLKKMREKTVGAVVIKEGQHITGIFTERDFLYRIALHNLDLKDIPIGEVMTPSPVLVNLSHSLAFALREMAMGRYRHLPVMDDQNQCVGILSADGILRYLIDHLEE